MPEIFKERLKKGRAAIGGWCVTPSADMAGALAECGFDWVCLDMQHGGIEAVHMAASLDAIIGAGKPALVRLAFNRPELIMRALDSGACGIIIPMVETGEEAAEAVKYAKSPPVGLRSWGAVRHTGEGYSPETGNQRVIVAPMIETAAGMRNIEEIAAVPGVDALFVGPYDLALSHGLKFPSESADYESMIYKVIDICIKQGIIAGIYCDGPDMARKWIGAGVPMIACSSDIVMFRAAAAGLIGHLRNA